MSFDPTAILRPPKALSAWPSKNGDARVVADAPADHSFEAMEAEFNQQNDDAGEQQAESFGPVPLGKLWESDPELHEPILDGLLRRRQVGNLISTSKSYKTYLMLGLAISAVTGKMWLERFQTAIGRVLIIDLELPKPDITRRTHDIAAAMHAPLEDVGGGIDVISFRGRQGTIDQIEKLLLGMKPRSYVLVIIDPLYKTYPAQFDENSNAQMTVLYRRWERMAEHLDCAVLIVHHGTKGSQSEKRVVDVGAGASAQSRSADAHITLREHETDDCVVFDARVRSFKPVEPMVLRWQFPLWHRDLALDPTQLKTGRKSRNADREQPLPEEPGIVWTVDKFIETFVTADPQDKRLIVSRASVADLSGRKAEDFIRLAIADGKAFLWSFPKDKKAYISNRQQGVTDCEVHQ